MRKNITPSKHWYHLNSKRHITDNLLRQRGYDQLFNTNYGKGTNNEELMRKQLKIDESVSLYEYLTIAVKQLMFIIFKNKYVF